MSGWIPISGGGSLDDLTDVDLTGLADGDILVYDSGSTTWLPEAPSGSGGAFVLLDEVIISGSPAASIEFTAIDQSHKDLKLVASLASDRASNNSDLIEIVFGDGSYDTGASAYRWVIHYASAATPVVADGADPQILCGRIAGDTADSGTFGLLDALIANYTETVQRTMTYTGGGFWNNGTAVGTAAGDDVMQVSGIGVWVNTSDTLERLQLAPNGGSNFKVGSWARLYGLG
jgi:hypothetical protein